VVKGIREDYMRARTRISYDEMTGIVTKTAVIDAEMVGPFGELVKGLQADRDPIEAPTLVRYLGPVTLVEAAAEQDDSGACEEEEQEGEEGAGEESAGVEEISADLSAREEDGCEAPA
jgi:hypothetical protein